MHCFLFYIVVDLNDTLHQALRRAKSKDALLRKVVADIKKMKKLTRVEERNLFIFCDGVAPLAKLDIQIKRRRNQSTRWNKVKKKGLDPLHITPGTEMTSFLEQGIRLAFPNSYVSGFGVSGEGEVKAILKSYRNYLIR